MPVELPQTVPYLLVYVDLILIDDPRCIVTAKIIYKQYLKDLNNE
ncbi:type IV toxin-antitoxin system AbiEi family antitoxin [Arachidicoccus sp.]